MIKLKYIGFTIFLLLAGSVKSMGQFITVRLELPAGMAFESRRIAPSAEDTTAKVYWVEMVAQENLTLLLELRDEETGEISPGQIYYLNDGSTDFAKAKLLDGEISMFRIDKNSLLIQNIQPKAVRLRSWIGWPIDQGIIKTIEYN